MVAEWAAPAGGAHVLIVDDDPRVRAMLARYLKGEGFRVGEAGDGTAVRACLARDTPDLVLLDLNLPGEDGLTLARELRAAHPALGLVMVTGRADVIDKVVGLEVGADDYIAKPFNLREVLARVRTVPRRARPLSRPPRRKRRSASRAGSSSPPSAACGPRTGARWR